MMKSIAIKSCFFVIFFLLLSQSAQSYRKTLKLSKPCKEFVLYFHETTFDGINIGVENATAIRVANATKLGDYLFGMMIVFNDPVTEDENFQSPPVATAQGFYFYDKKTNYTNMISFSLVFDSVKHKGTLQIMGADLMDQDVRDLAVVGGTGDFLMSRGFVTVRQVAQEGFFYYRLKLDIKLYECYNK
ncbi:Dirigent protein [Euphorbia peplus]|nr:Dirigent protein [Euphorbia peplus]